MNFFFFILFFFLNNINPVNTFNLFLTRHEAIEKIGITPHYIQNMDNYVITTPVENKLSIIKFFSNILPQLDFISHNVLQSNKQFINMVLDCNIPVEIKKLLILKSIEFVQFGDSTGTQILELYHEFVKQSL